jgi:putative transcriptional regulator
MGNHPSRSKRNPKAGVSPTPAQILAAREAAGITQTEAAALLHTSCRVWQQWEAGDRRMHPAFFELFQVKVKGPAELRRVTGGA